MFRLSFALVLATAFLVPAQARSQSQSQAQSQAQAQFQAQADNYCSRIPRALWLSSSEIREELQQRGLKLEQIRFADQKCYAVRVLKADGRREELIVDPATGDIMP